MWKLKAVATITSSSVRWDDIVISLLQQGRVSCGAAGPQHTKAGNRP